MFSDYVVCFQVFCFYWLMSEHIVSLIEKNKIGTRCKEFAAIFAQNIRVISAILTDAK